MALFEAANIYIKIRVNSLQDSVSLSLSHFLGEK